MARFREPRPLARHVELFRSYANHYMFVSDVTRVIWAAYGVSSSIGKMADKANNPMLRMVSCFKDAVAEDHSDWHTEMLIESSFPRPQSVDYRPSQFGGVARIPKGRKSHSISLEVHQKVARGFVTAVDYLQVLVAAYGGYRDANKLFSENLRYVTRLRDRLHEAAMAEHQESPYPHAKKLNVWERLLLDDT